MATVSDAPVADDHFDGCLMPLQPFIDGNHALLVDQL